MSKNKKVAIVSCFFMHNYGSQLQAYATQKIFDKYGVENETINCVKPINYMRESKLKYIYHKLITGDFYMKLSRVKIKLIKKFYDKNFSRNSQIRDKKFEEFIRKYYKLSKKYSTFDELKKATSNYKAFIVGSDQLWKPDSISHGYYTLDFVPDNVFKASYATSFGIKEMPKYQVKKCGAFLKRFDFLSTREVSGKEIIKNTSGKDAVVVADPTLMLTSNDWDAIQPKERIIKEKYIFCYFLGKASWHREFAKKIKDITGYKIVSILHTDEYVKEDNKFADFSPYDVNPGDFLNLIKNAEYVCTDSFHCSVFSVIFKKLFFTFNRFDASKKQSTNTRIDSLLGILKLEDRRVLSPDYDLNVLMNKLINYEQVDESLSSLCESSKIYLDQLISKIKEV